VRVIKAVPVVLRPSYRYTHTKKLQPSRSLLSPALRLSLVLRAGKCNLQRANSERYRCDLFVCVRVKPCSAASDKQADYNEADLVAMTCPADCGRRPRYISLFGHWHFDAGVHGKTWRRRFVGPILSVCSGPARSDRHARPASPLHQVRQFRHQRAHLPPSDVAPAEAVAMDTHYVTFERCLIFHVRQRGFVVTSSSVCACALIRRSSPLPLSSISLVAIIRPLFGSLAVVKLDRRSSMSIILETQLIIHAEHVVHSAWILFWLWIFVCMFVCMLAL